MKQCDPTPDPEDVVDFRTRLAAIDNFEAFMKFLAPPPRGTVDQAARDGEQIFNAIGCAACHVPVLADRLQRPSALLPARRAALLGSPAARRRHGRRHSAGLGAAERASHAGAVGIARPPPAPARRQRQHGRRSGCPPPRRGGRRSPAVRAVEHRAAESAGRVPEFALGRVPGDPERVARLHGDPERVALLLRRAPWMRRARRSSAGRRRPGGGAPSRRPSRATPPRSPAPASARCFR